MKGIRWMGSTAVFVLALAFSAPGLRAQTSLSIKGTITDKDRKAVASATVWFTNATNNQRVTSATTDGKGNYLKNTDLPQTPKGYYVEPSFGKESFTPGRTLMQKSGTANFVMNKGGFGQKVEAPTK